MFYFYEEKGILKMIEENQQNGYVKMYRSLLNWEWYTVSNTFKVFIHCLLRANFKDENWRGIKIKRGQFLTGRKKLSAETGLSEMQIRTALKNLELTNEITIEPTRKYSIITINKYNEYQNNYSINNQQITNEQPYGNQQVTTNNNEKNDNKGINITTTTTEENFIKKNPDFKFRGEYKNVGLTDRQYNNLSVMIMNKKKLDQYIEELSEKIAEKTDNEKKFDFDYPDMHKIRLKKYWIADKNKNRNKNSSKNKTKCSDMTETEKMELIEKERAESNYYEYNS